MQVVTVHSTAAHVGDVFVNIEQTIFRFSSDVERALLLVAKERSVNLVEVVTEHTFQSGFDTTGYRGIHT